MDRRAFRLGLRLGVPYATAGFLLALSFGVLAVQAGFTVLQAIVTAAVVFAGSAQFAALAIVSAGGGIGAAVLAATLMHSRFLAMGIVLAPSLPGGPLRRAVEGQAVIDSSWALANRGDGTFDRWLLIGTTVPQYATWAAGTAVGAVAGNLLGDPESLGLDVLFPTFFIAILVAELRRPRARAVAVMGAAIALALVPFAPPGIPVLAAAAAALVGLATPPAAEPDATEIAA